MRVEKLAAADMLCFSAKFDIFSFLHYSVFCTIQVFALFRFLHYSDSGNFAYMMMHDSPKVN